MLAKVRSLVVIGVLALVAVITVVWAIVTDDQSDSARAGCVVAKPSIPAPSAVKVRVFNGTDKQGLAGQIADQLRKRGFQVLTVAADPLDEPVGPDGQIRYGPAGAGAAALMEATVQGAEIVDDGRSDASIDIVLGIDFKELTPEDQVPAVLEKIDPPTVATPAAGC